MLSNIFGHTGCMSLFYYLLPLLWLGVILYLGLAVIRLNVSRIMWLNKPKTLTIQKYKNYSQRLNHSKNRILYLSKSKNRLILCGLNCVLLNLLFQSNTAFSQTDTLTSSQKDSIAYYYLPFMIAELKDYDLLKQKSAIQEKQIKGLQAISSNQKSLSVRQSIKIENFSTSLLNSQTKINTLQISLDKTTRQRNWARLENWIYRGGAIYLLGKFFKLY